MYNRMGGKEEWKAFFIIIHLNETQFLSARACNPEFWRIKKVWFYHLSFQRV